MLIGRLRQANNKQQKRHPLRRLFSFEQINPYICSVLFTYHSYFFRFDRWALDGSEATMVAGGESAWPPFFNNLWFIDCR